MMKKGLLFCLSMFLVCASATSKAENSVQDDNEGVVSQLFVIAIPQEESAKHINATMTQGFQESLPPKFFITGKDKRYMFGIGGFVNFRTAYDIDGKVNNLDFITYDIPIPNTAKNKAGILMDVSTSRLFFKFTGTKGALRGLNSYIETDFRGQDNSLHLRKAYISYRGWLVGQNATTFCDLMAAPTTIDYQGPNAYTYGRNIMIRFRHAFNNHLSMAIALEKPIVNATYTTGTESTSQRVPDIPIYFQYNFGEMNNHLRVSAIMRNMTYYDVTEDNLQDVVGWGVQLSGNIYIIPKLRMFMQGVYGRGIAAYIQDLQKSNLDLVPNPNHANKLQEIPMAGYFGGLQYNFNNKIFASATYSQTMVYNRNGYFVPDQYRYAQYIVGNAFWNITPSCLVGIEYLYGSRHNMNGDKNHANRIQVMAQYNF